jgi:hypothetical protein
MIPLVLQRRISRLTASRLVELITSEMIANLADERKATARVFSCGI